VLPCRTPASNDAPGPVEAGVQAEIAELAHARPGVAQMALAMARILDATAVDQQLEAAKVLATLLDKPYSPSARGRRGGLALVRTMTETSGCSSFDYGFPELTAYNPHVERVSGRSGRDNVTF
jgi:hypothetical protein